MSDADIFDEVLKVIEETEDDYNELED